METLRESLYSEGPPKAKRPLLEPSSLDVFADDGVEKAMSGSRENIIYPLPYDDKSAIQFQIKRIPFHYLDLSSAVLCGGVSVTRTDTTTGSTGKNLVDNVALCNYFPAALFKTMEIDIGGQNVSRMNSSYFHYKSYLQTLLTYGSEAKHTFLKAAGWVMDQPGNFEKFFSDPYTERKSNSKFSRITDFALPLQSSIFALDRLFPDFLDIDVRFTRNDDSIPLFHHVLGEEELIKPEDPNDAKQKKQYEEEKKLLEEQKTSIYALKLHNIRLVIRRIVIKHDLVEEHQRLLKADKLLRFPWTRSEMKLGGMIHAGTKQLKINDLYSDRLPSSLIIGLISSNNFLGSMSKNPFYFKNFGLSQIHIEVNQRRIPADGYRPDFENDHYMKEYLALFENTGLHGTVQSNGITKELFKDGCTLYAFDLSPDKCLNQHKHGEEFGILNVSIELKKALHGTITVLCLAHYDEVLSIDKAGQCFFDVAIA